MLKTKIPNNDIILQTNIVSEDYSSDRDFYNQKLLNFTKNTVINDISDSEVYEYKPDSIDQINFNIFFLHYVQNNEYSQLRKYVESGFTTQYNNTKVALGLTNTSGIEISKAFNNVYETRQSNGLREEPILSEKTLTKFQALREKPYVVRDLIGESSLKKPIKSGIPVFYNSFTLPFWPSKDKWLNEPLLYTNKPYFYNSFLLMEIYDSTSIVSQNRIQSIPIFVNSRYNITEKNITNNFHYERPCFKLSEGVDGFSFFFLGNYITNEFYVKYSFWDGLNGKKISLIPSSNLDPKKKWLQDPDNFNQNIRYLKYVLDYKNKTYKIYEYNTVTKEYDSERSGFDLYQLEFDSYYKNRVVPNQKPVDSRSLVTTKEISNPLTFTIKNLYTSNFVSETNKLPSLTTSEMNGLKTFLNNKTKNFINVFNSYTSNLDTEVFGELAEKNISIPVINRNVKAYQVPVKSFIFKNTDTKSWTVRSLEFKDITVMVNNSVINNAVYNQRQTLWNEKPSYRVGEAITILHGSELNVTDSTDATKFTRNVLTKYMENPSVFRALLNAIERERYKLSNGEDYYTENSIPTFITKCFTKLGVTFFKKSTHNSQYTGSAVINANLPNFTLNYDYSEIYYYIEKLTQKYSTIKNTNLTAFNDIRDSAVSLLVLYEKNQYDSLEIVKNVIGAIESSLNPKDNPELVDEYLRLVSQKNISNTDRTILKTTLTKEKVAIDLDTNITDMTNQIEIRNYALTMYAVQNGDKFIIPNESNKIDVYFNIGEKLNFLVSSASEITIRGKLRLSIINSSGDIKNIAIPIKSVIKAKKPTGSIGRTKLPAYTVPTRRGGGTKQLNVML